ncbi:MAG TPA: RNB domain-containing ribonuclease, partial [Terriglobia bacterium]|nr:RNB domain-containing ribonuclease [Terriglobia bacterium]
ILDRIQNWLRFKTGDEIGLILEEIAGAAKARDAAYDILLRTGRVDPTLDRFLVTAGIDPHFSSPLIEAAAQLTPYTHIPARLDYQYAPAFTIDDEDTREVDDALTVRWEGDEIVVGIHIADVSAFVTKGDILDAEASRRSSTIYLPSITVPMFPERLSTDMASLRTEVPRPAFTVEVRFDKQANRAGYRIALSTIKVQKRLSYDEADQIIETDPALYTLHRIAKQLHDARSNRGAITFRRAELKIRVKGDEIQITKINPNSPSRFVVSEMMILANGLAADFASVNSIPVIYRTQEPREALAAEDTLRPALGGVDSTRTAPWIRHDPQRDLESPALDGVDSTGRLGATYKSVEALAFERLRKTFKRSRLSLTPGLHSGLGLGAYTQASSPIRRYADLVTQRQFTATLSGVPVPYGREELLQILAAAEAAEQEIRAIEDRSTNYWLLEYLARYKRGESLAAVVLDPKGNIELQDYYLRGRVSGLVKLQPGEMVDVRIETIDPAKGEVRFRAV